MKLHKVPPKFVTTVTNVSF